MNYNKSFLAGVIFLFSVGCFYSCAKENMYKGVVTVSRLEAADSLSLRIPVPDCLLIFGYDDYDPEIQRTVYTDATGKYAGEWKREVTLPVQASREIGGQMYTGKSMLRLSLAGVQEVEILITPEQ